MSRPAGERPVRVAVVGGGDAGPAVQTEAAEVGRLLAQAGAEVVCGGLEGVMAAVCRGVAEAGGVTIGIVPGRDRHQANDWVTHPIATGLGELRNLLVVTNADVVVAMAGEWGTLSEIALARRHGVPVVGLRTWELSQDGAPEPSIIRATSPAEAVALALREAEAVTRTR